MRQQKHHNYLIVLVLIFLSPNPGISNIALRTTPACFNNFTILNFKKQPLNSGNYLEATKEIHDKYGKIILLFFIFHLMTFLISFFFSINTSKVSVKSQRKK